MWKKLNGTTCARPSVSHKSHYIGLPIIDKLLLVTLSAFIVIIIITMEVLVLPNPKSSRTAPTPIQPDVNIPTKGLEMGDVK